MSSIHEREHVACMINRVSVNFATLTKLLIKVDCNPFQGTQYTKFFIALIHISIWVNIYPNSKFIFTFHVSKRNKHNFCNTNCFTSYLHTLTKQIICIAILLMQHTFLLIIIPFVVLCNTKLYIYIQVCVCVCHIE